MTILSLLTLEEWVFKTEIVESEGGTGKLDKGTCDSDGSKSLIRKVVSNKAKGDWWRKRVVGLDKGQDSKAGIEKLKIVSEDVHDALALKMAC